jgi:inorganic pyrophosphatase
MPRLSIKPPKTLRRVRRSRSGCEERAWPIRSAPREVAEMPNLLKIPTWADEEHIYAVVETPRGSTCKLDFDPQLRAYACKTSDGRPRLSL